MPSETASLVVAWVTITYYFHHFGISKWDIPKQMSDLIQIFGQCCSAWCFFLMSCPAGGWVAWHLSMTSWELPIPQCSEFWHCYLASLQVDQNVLFQPGYCLSMQQPECGIWSVSWISPGASIVSISDIKLLLQCSSYMVPHPLGGIHQLSGWCADWSIWPYSTISEIWKGWMACLVSQRETTWWWWNVWSRKRRSPHTVQHLWRHTSILARSDWRDWGFSV
jgi:hypothetical protein